MLIDFYFFSDTIADMNQPHNIYIHVPFCLSKCKYCAFFSAACTQPDWDKYTNGIISEIDYWAEKLGPIDVPTMFFGGGTPSLMPVDKFTEIIGHIAKRFHIVDGCEITLESNPKTLDVGRLGNFIRAGVNRLSVGVQSLDDARLKFLGRQHNADDARELLAAATRLGVRVSADFIYGLPGDTPEYVAKMCRDINELGLKHASLYELTIEPNTPFGKMNLDMPSNIQMAEMYDAIGGGLNLPRYEVSNYATRGNECRHNQNIWDGAPYIGLGRGAAGRVLLDGAWYEQMGDGVLFKQMTDENRAIEKIITGLRTMRGVAMTPDVAAQIDMDWAIKNPEYVTVCGGRICATEKGLLILDNLLLNLTR